MPTFLHLGITTDDRDELIAIARNSPFASDRCAAIMHLSTPRALTELRRPVPPNTGDWAESSPTTTATTTGPGEPTNGS